jgi:hypothetical protein
MCDYDFELRHMAIPVATCNGAMLASRNARDLDLYPRVFALVVAVARYALVDIQAVLRLIPGPFLAFRRSLNARWRRHLRQRDRSWCPHAAGARHHPAAALRLVDRIRDSDIRTIAGLRRQSNGTSNLRGLAAVPWIAQPTTGCKRTRNFRCASAVVAGFRHSAGPAARRRLGARFSWARWFAVRFRLLFLLFFSCATATMMVRARALIPLDVSAGPAFDQPNVTRAIMFGTS